MLNQSRAKSVVSEMCAKLHCSELAVDLERVNNAREKLEKLQLAEFFENLQANKTPTKFNTRMSLSHNLSHVFLKTKQRLDNANAGLSTSSNEGTSDESIKEVDEESVEPEDIYVIEKSEHCIFDNLDNDAWMGFFDGYEILEENQECILSENKQCIELTLATENSALESYLRTGVRCFMIDLFIGTELEKQKLIFKLRESELKVSREYGFPITTTLFALLSPRLQYTGLMDVVNTTAELSVGDTTILTTKKKYSSSCTSKKIYVNARFLLEDCSEGDFILVGPSIQLMVTKVSDEELRCEVMEAGILTSRLPVRFPAKCNRLHISLEELEDLTFAREVGINVLVSYLPVSKQYFNDLTEAVRLLKYNDLRIFTRLVLNQYEEEEDHNLDWIAENYDGFLIDLSAQVPSCHDGIDESQFQIPNILNISPDAMNFMTKIFNMKKPIVLNPSVIAERQLFVQPYNIPHIFYYPDKFLFSMQKHKNAFFFYFLQNALTEGISRIETSKKLFCDPSDAGDDTLARACIAAAFESQAKAIIVCSCWPDMAIKLSHFRPKVPIVLVSETESIAEYISLYHHLIFMRFPNRQQNPQNYVEYVTNAFIFCVIFLNIRNILYSDQNVILVYGTEPDNKLCDKYVVYKFKEKNFDKNLEEILFT